MAEIIVTEELKNKIEELINNKEFATKLCGAQAVADVQSLFKAEGVDVDAEAAQAVIDKLDAICENGGELSEEEMELVSGGSKWIAIGCIVGGALAPCSLGLSIAVGAAIACGGSAIQDMRKRK